MYFLAGKHSVVKLVQRFAGHVNKVYVTDAFYEKQRDCIALCKEKHIRVQKVAKDHLEQLLPNANAKGIVAEVSQLPTLGLNSVLDACKKKPLPLLLVLDKVQDPQNLGAILRSAAAFEVDAVIAGKHACASLTPTAIRVSCGGALVVPFVRVVNVAKTLIQLKKEGFWVYVTSEHADKTLQHADTQRPLAWVMGNEGAGVSDHLHKHCDASFCIDVSSAFSTLNVSVSTGICLYETARSRLDGQ